MPTPMDGLAGRWTHSFEEDHDDIAVYRPSDHDFPRARGRDGIEFSTDGSFTEWAVGRGDAREPIPGRWRAAETNSVAVNTEQGGEQVLEVVHLAPDRLEVRRRAGR
jgi:hypothetical protein